MKIASLASARPQYYDRNSIGIANVNSVQVTNTTTTTLTMYTVPTGKKCIISMLALQFENDSAMSGAGAYAYGRVPLTIFATSTTANLIAKRFYQTALGATEITTFSPSLALNAGDVIKLVTTANATFTGATTIMCTVAGTEFDA